MRTIRPLVAAVLALVVLASSSAAQPLVGALAVDARQGEQWGWAVDYETTAAAQAAALRECGSGCSVALTFGRCGAYAADQDDASTASGWAESYASADGARQRALAACRSRGGSGCVVRVWGCNGPVVEEGLGLDRAARRQIQQGLQAGGFDPGGMDGLFGPRTRAAIRGWQSVRGARPTGYLDGPQVEALRGRGGSGPMASASPQPAASAGTGGLEVVFWQSVVNSTNPADFEAYLEQFPNGVFRTLAQNRLAALSGAARSPAADARTSAEAIGGAASGSRVSGAPARATGSAAGGDVRSRPGGAFRPTRTCAGQPVGAACWQEISRQPGCYVWNQNRQPGSIVTWAGECTGGLGQGMGTLTWVWEDNRETLSGRLDDGQHTGHWVLRHADGGVSEGLYVDSERNGHWILRFADGAVSEGPFVEDERNGNWVQRFADGTVAEGRYLDGKENGTWVIRWADGTVEEWLYRDGERVR